jgi:hypothetical protein
MDERDRIQRLASDASGASVTDERLRTPVGSRQLSAFLEAAEQPHHVLRGRLLDMFERSQGSAIEESQTRKIPSKGGDLFTLVTDRRILFLIERDDEPDRVSIPLEEVSGIDYETALGTNTRLRIRTDAKEYLVDTSASGEEHTRAASEFVTAQETESGPAVESGGVVETIEKLADLNERGALTDEEFEEKKAELLDRL